MNLEDAKKIIKDIIVIEEEKYNTKINLELLGRLTFFKNEIKNNSIKLFKPSAYLTLLMSNGLFLKNSNKSVIFVTKLNEVIFTSNNLRNLVDTVFHEIRHHYQFQHNIPKSDYERFLINIERITLCFTNIGYEYRYMELDAFYYSRLMTKKHLNLNDPLYDLLILEAEYKLKTFNPNFYFKIFHKVLTKNRNLIPKSLIFFFNTFYNNDFTFKSIHEIMHQINKEPIDLEVIVTIFSSKVFLEQLDFENLSKEELEFLYLMLVEKLKFLTKQINITRDYYNKIKEIDLPDNKKIRYILKKILLIITSINDDKIAMSLYKKRISYLVNKINKTQKYRKLSK